eukprot:TRINITY_DN5711_c0_g1_i1.p1 TRINITY_DN5711_c0_g1~~TRINITY_DN5711_c0_g1_i1.p1  ORF type:complete len:348 (-),score=179.22 TRINITY_DN5711_c0_g1_i1:182-1225(-)
MVTGFWEYAVASFEHGEAWIKQLPKALQELAATLGLEALLDMEMLATMPFVDGDVQDEMRGLAAGANISLAMLWRVHLMPELKKGHCSLFGAQGSATASVGGRLLQLRALDWSVDAPVKNYPALIVYHSDAGADWINIGWAGWLGSISGLNQHLLSISEIGIGDPDSTFGQESRQGQPFVFMLRDILAHDARLKDAIQRLQNAHRTCNLVFGVGDFNATSTDMQFRAFQLSASVCNVYDSTDMKPTASWHPLIEDIAYLGMDWNCPGWNAALSTQLSKYHGNVTAANVIRDVLPIVQTGDMHAVLYDLADDTHFYVANARRDNQTGPLPAYDRQFIQFNAQQLFSVA